jgi:hypothetical protein
MANKWCRDDKFTVQQKSRDAHFHFIFDIYLIRSAGNWCDMDLHGFETACEFQPRFPLLHFLIIQPCAFHPALVTWNHGLGSVTIAMIRCGNDANIELFAYQDANGSKQMPTMQDIGASHIAFYTPPPSGRRGLPHLERHCH